MKAAAFALCIGSLTLASCQEATPNGSKAAGAQGPTKPDTNPQLVLDTMLVSHQCSNCHAVDYLRVGPPMEAIRASFPNPTAADVLRLKTSILQGSTGKWSEAVMPPQKQVTPEQVDQIVQTILGTTAASAK